MSHKRLEEGGFEFRKRMMDFNLAVKKTAFQLTRKNICPMLVTFGQTLLYTTTLMPHARRAPSNHENSKGYGHETRDTPACRNAVLRRAGTDTLFSI